MIGILIIILLIIILFSILINHKFIKIELMFISIISILFAISILLIFNTENDNNTYIIARFISLILITYGIISGVQALKKDKTIK